MVKNRLNTRKLHIGFKHGKLNECVFFSTFNDKDMLNVTWFSLPVCDVISTCQQQRKVTSAGVTGAPTVTSTWGNVGYAYCTVFILKMRAEKVNLLVALHLNKRLIHLPLIVVYLFISKMNLNQIPLQETTGIQETSPALSSIQLLISQSHWLNFWLKSYWIDFKSLNRVGS